MLLLLLASSGALEAQAITAREVIERIRREVGVAWAEITVDTVKAGDPETPVTGIATTMMATYDVLVRAAAEGKNLVITHEPVFYGHLDQTEAFEAAHDAVWSEKAKFIRDHHMVVFRFHDHWHRRKPDGVMEGMTAALGWEPYRAQPAGMFRIPPTTVEALAAAVKKKLGVTVLRVVGARDLEVKGVALAPGAGGEARHLDWLRRDDVDVLMVGEVPEWETISYVADAAAEHRRKALILIGHTPSEQAGMKNCADWLRKFVPEVPVGFVAAAEPFWEPR